MSFTFKEYEDQDFDDLKEMIFCLYAEDPTGEPVSDAKIRDTVREGTAHPEKVRIVMIRADGINVGYSIIVFYWSNEYGGDVLHIDELFVKEEYRNKKAASVFIEYVKTAFQSAAALQLETTPENAAATRLYTRLGFELSQNNHLVLVIPAREE